MRELKKRVEKPSATRERIAMINHAIGTVTDIVTTAESVTEIEEVTVTETVIALREIRRVTVNQGMREYVTLRRRKKIKIKGAIMTQLGPRKQVNNKTEIVAYLLLKNKNCFISLRFKCMDYVQTLILCIFLETSENLP